MKLPDGVLRFSHIYASAIWGGDAIPRLYRRADAPYPCSESWEISAHPHGTSVVKGGSFDGTPLDELVRQLGTELVGRAAPDVTRFPLLFKLIDARLPLSVQVHPGEKTALASGGEPKSEAWCVIDAKPGSVIYAGIRKGVAECEFAAAASHGDSVAGLLCERPVACGDMAYIPGGTTHAIGGGLLIYEVQQASDTTFRIYDWGRVGQDGKPRTLHLREAAKAVDFGLAPPELSRGSLRTPYFHIRDIVAEEPVSVKPDGSTFTAVFVASGSISLASAGESLLIPAVGDEVVLEPVGGQARIILTTLR